MRLLTILFTLFTVAASAQIVEIPLATNPVLEQVAQKKEAIQEAKRQTFIERYALPAPSTARNNETIDTIVISGESLMICQDTTDMPEATLTCLNCATAEFGTGIIDSTCLVYTSNAGLILEMETISVEFCTTPANCDTIHYPIVIKRANTISTEDVIVLEATESIEFCVDTTGLPGNWMSTTILTDTLCSEYQDHGTLITASGICGLYESTLFADSDEVCVVICDDATVCDTITFPFVVRQDTLSLPFFDDFTNASSYPNDENWLNNTVFVNQTLGYQPPSVGVATFDGLDAGGSPYNMGNNLPSDILTSAYLDLSGVNDVYLSYYIQPKGNGDKPDTKDSLVLQFKNQLDQWVNIKAYAGLGNDVGNDSIPLFQYDLVSAEFTSDYKYNGFQFRFLNKSGGTGFIDHWNLDYVLLDVNSQGSIFNDVAFTELPNDILSPYSSMPWQQFDGNEASELDSFIVVEVLNHSDTIASITESSVHLTELTTSTTVYDVALFNPESIRNLPVGRRKNIFFLDTEMVSGVESPFPNLWTNQGYLSAMQNDFNGSQTLEFELKYEIITSNYNNSIGASSNDIVSRTTIFDNYFAYDDGTAEANIAAQGAGTQIAVEFDANIGTELTGIQISIPHIKNNVSTQLFNLKVWQSLEEDPLYETGEIAPVYVDMVYDSLQGLTTYRFDEPVNINAGKFYVGWEQVSDNFANAIPIGLDKNNQEGADLVYGYVDGAWLANDGDTIVALNILNPGHIRGSMMIRPIVGENIPFSTNVETLADTSKPFKIYPNPSAGQFFVDLKLENYSDFDLQVFNGTGQLIQESMLQETLNLQDFSDGIYFLKILNKKTNKIFHERVIIAK